MQACKAMRRYLWELSRSSPEKYSSAFKWAAKWEETLWSSGAGCTFCCWCIKSLGAWQHIQTQAQPKREFWWWDEQLETSLWALATPSTGAKVNYSGHYVPQDLDKKCSARSLRAEFHADPNLGVLKAGRSGDQCHESSLA